MQFSKPVMQIIKQRKSIRSYTDKPIEQEKIEAANKFLSASTTGPFGTKSRFIFITASAQDREALKGFITYGMIKNPMGFIIGAVENAPHHLEDFGYLMEKNILMATDLGLGTCWLGGTFSSSRFAQKIGLKNNEILPAVTPVGYAVQKISSKDSLVRGASGADNRKKWEALFFQNNKPLSVEEAGKYAVPLEMVRLAPSANNFQPWRIIKDPISNTFHFYLKRVPGLKQFFFMKSDLQLLDIGIAMSHFALAADEEGLKGKWKVNDPRPGGIAGKMDYIITWEGGN